MSDPFAAIGDLQDRWPSLPSTQAGTAEVLLGDASVFLRTQYPGLDAQAANDTQLAAVLTIVVCAMVKRAMLAGMSGVSQESEGTGPYNHSVTYANPSGNLFVTKAEDQMIRGYKPKGGSFLYGNTTTQIGDSYEQVYGY